MLFLCSHASALMVLGVPGVGPDQVESEFHHCLRVTLPCPFSVSDVTESAWFGANVAAYAAIFA